MTTDTCGNVLSAAATKFAKIVKKPAKFVEPSPDLFEEIKTLTKVLYDLGQLREDRKVDSGLPQLIVQDFDEEQVWAGIETRNSTQYDLLSSRFRQLNFAGCSLVTGNKKTALRPDKVKSKKVDSEQEEDEDSDALDDDDELLKKHLKDDDQSDEEQPTDKTDDDGDIFNDPDFQNMSDSDGDDLPLFDGLSDDEKSDNEEGTYRAKEKRSAKGKKTVVDDDFFKLRDMEAFLDREDQRENRKQNASTGGANNDEDEDDDNDEEDIDLFDDVGDNGDDEGAMYADFFHADEDEGGEHINGEDQIQQNDEGDESMEQESDDEEHEPLSEKNNLQKSKKNNLFDSDGSESEQEEKSSHQLAEEKLKKKIQRMEDEAVGDKKWQMIGEAAAPVRPENSLLAEDLDYESGVRQAPVITEEVARKLEDIIKQRIKDQAWDDVERKVKPIEDPQEYRKRLVLDQEKSKLSLSQIYEQEYLRVSEATEKKEAPSLLDKEAEDTPKEVEEIKSAMQSLFAKLDALTHFHYTPKQKSAEVKIVRNVPSIAVEEVAPVGVSNADLLAPAEVVDKQKGDPIGDSERTETDKKRARRDKKAKKRAAIKEKAKQEKLAESSNVGASKKLKDKKIMRELELAEKQGKLKRIKEKDKDAALKSSTAFFKVLQEETKSSKKEKKSKKKENKISASSLRL